MDQRKAAILAEIPRLRRYARALLRDPDAADDLVQDCLERALARGSTTGRRVKTRGGGCSPSCINLFIDQTRAHEAARAKW